MAVHFRFPLETAKIAFRTCEIVASLDCISAVQYMIYFTISFHSLKSESLLHAENPTAEFNLLSLFVVRCRITDLIK